MKLFSIVLALLLSALAASSAYGSAPGAAGTPQGAAKHECKALADLDAEAFGAVYGNAMGACMNAERRGAGRTVRESTVDCRGERAGSKRSHEAFRDRYRTASGANDAFTNCVAVRVWAEIRAQLAAFRRAISECRAELGSTPESIAAFELKYGSSDDPFADYRPTLKAFANCVFSKLRV